MHGLLLYPVHAAESGQFIQDVQFLRRRRDDVSIIRNRPRFFVRHFRLTLLINPLQPHQLFHEPEQFLRPDRLGQKGVATGNAAPFPIRLNDAGGDRYDRRLPKFWYPPYLLNRLEAGHHRHHQIHEDEVGPDRLCLSDPLFPVRGQGDVKPERLQQTEQHQTVFLHVIRNEDFSVFPSFRLIAGHLPGFGHLPPGEDLLQYGQGNFKPEDRSSAMPAFRMNLPAHKTDQPAGDRQSQARPLGALFRIAGLLKRSEDYGKLFGSHADTCVPNLKPERNPVFVGKPAFDPQCDTSLICELDRVAQQVEQHLTQTFLIGIHRGRQIIRDIKDKFDILLVCGHPHDAGHAVQEIRQSDRDGIKLQFPGLDFCQVQDVVDKGEQMLPAFGDDIQAVGLSGGQSPVPPENLGIAQNAVEGSAEFMAHVGKKCALGLIGGLGCFFGLAKLMSPLIHLNLKPVLLALNGSHPPAESAGNQADHQNQHETSEPPAFPPGRRDDDFEGCPFLIPHAVVVGSPDPEGICAASEVSVGCEPPFRIRIIPISFKSLKHIRVAILIRGSVIQSRKLEGKHIIPVGKHHLPDF